MAEKLEKQGVKLRKSGLLKSIAVAVSLMLGASASAETTVITFDEMLSANDDLVLTSQYSSRGFNFAPSQNVSDFYMFFGEGVRQYGYIADPVGTTLVQNRLRTVSTVSREDGLLFDLLSIDFADLFNDGPVFNPVFVNLTLNYADNRVVSFDTRADEERGLQTVSVNGLGLRSFSFSTLAGGAQFDNFRLVTAAAAVPEPSSWAMMIVGFGVAGGALRRSRRRRIAAAFA